MSKGDHGETLRRIAGLVITGEDAEGILEELEEVTAEELREVLIEAVGEVEPGRERAVEALLVLLQ